MKEYICKEVQTENGGYLEIETELIRCKDCRWWWEGMRVCALKEHLVDGVCAVLCMEDDFCSRAEPKEINNAKTD